MQTVDFENALDSLKKGKILIYPTETSYGLGVDIHQSEAIAALFDLKKRSTQKALSILVSSLEQAKEYIQDFSPLAEKLWQAFLPGPLTLVLPASEKVSRDLTGGSAWVGIRLSSHLLAQKLVKSYGSPITTTSANLSGQDSAATEAQVKEYFLNKPVCFLPGGDLKSSPGSTVVKVEGERYEVLREGEISQNELKTVLGF